MQVVPYSLAKERVPQMTPPMRGGGDNQTGWGLTPRNSCNRRVAEMEAMGFEPTTLGLQSRCSPAELRPLDGGKWGIVESNH